jgi:hypothetical protein
MLGDVSFPHKHFYLFTFFVYLFRMENENELKGNENGKFAFVVKREGRSSCWLLGIEKKGLGRFQ